MTFRLNAQVMLRAVRDGLARLNGLIVETGNSEEDLVFHIRNSDRPLSDSELRELILPRLETASERRRAGRPN